MSADVMETSSKKRLSTSTSIDEFDGELEGFTELESQAPLSTAGNGPYVNGSISNAPNGGMASSSMMQQMLPQQQMLSSYQNQSNLSQPVTSHSQQSSSVLQDLLQSNPQSMNSPRTTFTGFSTKSPLPNSNAAIGQNIISPMNNSVGMQPTPQQRNQMPHSQIRSQTSNMIPPGAHIYDPNMPHQVGQINAPNGYQQTTMGSMNPQQQYNQAFPHPQQVRMYNQQAPMRVPQNAAPTGQTQVSRPAYNNGNMPSVNQRQMRQQVSQGPQQTPQIRQIMTTQMIPVSTQMGQNPTQFEAYHLTPSHAQMSGPSRNPHTPISEVYPMPTNGSGHGIHSSQGPPHHLQNTSQPTQVLMTTPMNQPLPQQRQPGFGMSAISNQNQMVAVPIEQQIHGNSQGSNQIPQNQQNSMIINGNVQQLIVHQKTVNPQGPMHAVQQQAQFTGPSGSMNAQMVQIHPLSKQSQGGTSRDQPGYPGAAEFEKKKLIQQQLVLLLHAHRCQQREKEHGKPCTVSFCDTMKNVLLHMTSCNAGRNCDFGHCASSKQIIQHWKNCKSEECIVCKPVKAFTQRENNERHAQEMEANSVFLDSGRMPDAQLEQNQVAMNSVGPPMYQPQNHSGMPPNFGSPPGPISAMNNLLMDYTPMGDPFRSSNPPNKVGQPQGQLFQGIPHADIPLPDNPSERKEWHKAITNDLRQHLIQKLVRAIFPSPDPAATEDPRIKDLISYAKKVEREMFEIANDKEMYYFLLAEKIYKIQKELQEKKNRRLNEQQNRSQDPGIPPPGTRQMVLQQQQYPFHQVKQSVQGTMFISEANVGVPPSKVVLNEPPAITISGVKREIKQEQQNFVYNSESSVTAPSPSNKKRKVDGECSVFPSTSGENLKIEPTSENLPAKRSLTPTDTKPVAQASLALEEIIPDPKVFDANELRSFLQPILDKIVRMEEAVIFREPVDPVLSQAKDYYDVIKNPMDLRTIGAKLDQGKYRNPWQFVDDMNLMLENARNYNRKNSKPHRWSTKLNERFQDEIDQIMHQMGYCCGQKHIFTQLSLLCYGGGLCLIARDQEYYRYEVASSAAQYGLTSYTDTEKYIYCVKCFNNLPDEGINLSEPTDNPNWVPKNKFIRMKNDHVDYEPFDECKICLRKWHRICANHCKNINPNFICDNCRKEKNKQKPENRFTAKRLPHCKLSRHLEDRVNTYIKENDTQAEVIIRVLCTTEREVEVKEHMKKKYSSESFPDRFPYRTKAIFAFEVIEGVEVCFFGLHVQEYGSNAPAPNSRRVYIAYLDSVNFFQPPKLRTNVYHEILLGYLTYVKRLGYTMAHIWACPPSEGDDYIFHCHPPQQKIPKPKRLQEWYKAMLDKGHKQKIVYEFKDIYKQARDDDLVSPASLPYFEGDYWPNVIEDCIRDAEKEDNERKKIDYDGPVDDEEDDLFQTDDGRSVKNSKSSKKKNNFKKASQKSKKKNGVSTGDKVTDKLYLMLEKHKDVFFTIHLFSPEEEEQAKRNPIVDPDGLVSSELMDGRDTFLSRSREEHWEFSSLRRAKWSSTNLCYSLHNQDQNKDMPNYNCNECETTHNVKYHCTNCEDYDLCEPCFKKIGHGHPMEQILTETQKDSTAGDREESIKRCIQSLIHACQCKDANCRKNTCQKMRKVLQHTKQCKQRQHSACPACKQLIALCCYHAKHCNTNNCPVPFCQNIRQKLNEQKRNANRRADQMMRRRMEQLQTTMNVPGPSTTSQQQTSQPISLTSSYSTQPPPSFNTTSFSQRISPQFSDSNSSVQMNPSAISSARQQAIMASPNAQQQSGMRMNGPGFHKQQSQGMAALDSPGGMSLPPQQTSIRGASHTTGPGSVPSQGMQGGYITGPGSQHHIPSMNSPSVSHQQQYIMSSGQLMQSPQNGVVMQRAPPIQSPNQQLSTGPSIQQQTGMQMNSQFYGREQLPPQHQQMYGQGMSPHNSEMRPYQQMPIGSHPAAGLQQRVQSHPIQGEQQDERVFYNIMEQFQKSPNCERELFQKLAKTPTILNAFLKWSRSKNLNINIADYGHIQQHHHPVEFDQTGQQPMMSAQIIAAQNGSQFNASPQQWAQSQSQHKPYQQRNMGQ